MFTGLVEQMGEVRSAGTRLAVTTPLASELQRGDSISVNGVCLTAVDITGDSFEADVMEETLERSALGRLQAGDRVNLELALRVGDRLGGHFVQGHVDGVGTVEGVAEVDDAMLVDIRVPPEVAETTVLHGAITVDGVSLTVNALAEGGIVQVSLVPFTREHTTLGKLASGDRVHVEADVLGKYVRQLCRSAQ